MHIPLLIAVGIFLRAIDACSTTDVKLTFYGYPDNTPSSATTAYDCGGRNYQAGGIGTYDDPLTFASSLAEYNECEVIYLPYLRKYLRMEDDCGQCDLDWDDNGLAHIDVWTNSAWDEDTTICEYALTPGSSQSIIRDPDNDLVVDSDYLYNDGTCGSTYPNDSASDYCADGEGGGDSSATFCESGCSWAGHCIGCSCTDFNDCSDDYVCNGGVCAAS